MAEVKCVATRESYGNALKELAAEAQTILLFLTQTFQQLQKQAFLKRRFPSAISTAVLQSQI